MIPTAEQWVTFSWASKAAFARRHRLTLPQAEDLIARTARKAWLEKRYRAFAAVMPWREVPDDEWYVASIAGDFDPATIRERREAIA